MLRTNSHRSPPHQQRLTGTPVSDDTTVAKMGTRIFDFMVEGCDLRDQRGEEAGELFFCSAAYLHDVFVVDGFGGFVSGRDDAGSRVGDERDAKDFEAHVAGNYGFVDGGHADEVGAEGAEGADLGGGFEAGAEDGEVDAFGELEALAGGFLDGECRRRASRRWTCRRSAGRRRG